MIFTAATPLAKAGIPKFEEITRIRTDCERTDTTRLVNLRQKIIMQRNASIEPISEAPLSFLQVLLEASLRSSSLRRRQTSALSKPEFSKATLNHSIPLQVFKRYFREYSEKYQDSDEHKRRKKLFSPLASTMNSKPKSRENNL